MALKSALKRPHLWLVFERIADETINSNWIQLKSKSKLEINATGDVGLEKINAKVIGWANKRDQRWIKQGEEGVSYKNFKNQIIKKKATAGHTSSGRRPCQQTPTKDASFVLPPSLDKTGIAGPASSQMRNYWEKKIPFNLPLND